MSGALLRALRALRSSGTRAHRDDGASATTPPNELVEPGMQRKPGEEWIDETLKIDDRLALLGGGEGRRRPRKRTE